MTPEDVRERLIAGDLVLGPATLTLFLPVLLPLPCCEESREARCGRCAARGFTHGAHASGDLRCVECQEYLSLPALARHGIIDLGD